MIRVRKEQPTDYRKIEEITRKAFWNLYIPGANEHYLVHNMRKHKDYMPELSFVIEKDNEIIGSIHFTHANIVTSDGEKIPVVHFGPVSITPELHRKGYGRELITHAIEQAKKAGHRAIILAGFRYHYEPYGFISTKKYDISMPDGKFYTGVMALPLYKGALDDVSGKIEFSTALYPDENGLEDYEKSFSPMEKLSLPKQKDFEKAASELDTEDYE